jgi:hypothetical protein
MLMDADGTTTELEVASKGTPFAERFFDALAIGDDSLQPISPVEAFAVSKNIIVARSS